MPFFTLSKQKIIVTKIFLETLNSEKLNSCFIMASLLINSVNALDCSIPEGKNDKKRKEREEILMKSLHKNMELEARKHKNQLYLYCYVYDQPPFFNIADNIIGHSKFNQISIRIFDQLANSPTCFFNSQFNFLLG